MTNSIRAQKVKKIKRIRKWKKCGIIVSSIFVTLFALIMLLIYTSAGLKLTTYILGKALPELKIEQTQGTLTDFAIKGLSLHLDGVEVNVNEASISLSGLCLLQGKACIKHFDADNVAVNVDTKAFPPSTEEQPVSQDRFIISMPIPIELRKTHLTHVNVNVDDMTFGLTDFEGSAIWINEKLTVHPSTAIGLKAIFADASSVSNPATNQDNETLPLSETIKQLFNQPLLDTLPEVSIPLDINVEGLMGNDWLLHIGQQDYHFDNVTIQTDMVNNHIMVKHTELDAKTPYVDGHASVIGEIVLGSDWPLSGSLNVKIPQNEIDANFEGKLLGELSANASLKGSNQLTVDTKINFIEKYLPIMAKINGKHIQWPITGDADYQLDDVSFSLGGNVQKYQLATKAKLSAKTLPNTSFDIVANGTNEGAIFDHALIKLPQGDVNISGHVSWLDALKWNTLIAINNLDLTKELPAYPIKLAGTVETNGSFKGEKWQADITKLLMKGNIRRADFDANGALFVNSDNQIAADNFKILWGKNQIIMNGSTQKDNFKTNLNLSSLSLIADEMKGTVIGDITMRGSVREPVIDTKLDVSRFSYSDIAIGKANITGDIGFADQINGHLSVTGNKIELPSLSVESLDVDLSGNESNHTLKINIAGSPVSFDTLMTGHIDKARTIWTGEIATALLTIDEKNKWQLSKKLPLSYDINQQIPTIGAHCWVNADASICLDKTLALAPKNQANVIIKNIDLAKIPLPNDGETKLAGNIDGKIAIQLNENGQIPAVKANLTGQHVYVEQMVTSQTLPIPFSLFTINANIDQHQAKFDWKFGLNEFGKINGNVVIDDPTGQKKLKGQLIIDKLSLSLFNPLLDSHDYANGAINGNVKFSGTLDNPYITGGIDLKQSEIKSSQLPVDIQSAMIDIDFKGKSSVLKGVLKTKSGDLNIKGNASWKEIDNWKATVTVNGAAIEVSIPPMIVMTVIPDVKLEATQDLLNLTGKIDIPKGKITVESLPPSTIDVSSDEVMLDKNLNQIEDQQFGMKINTDLEVNIGNKVSVDAFGLKAGLQGNLRVLQDNKGLGVHGQISIPKGRFHAYGQDLIIRKGEITFSGPTDQPALNVEAIRNPESIDGNITAGIRVTGLADDPKIEIFSDPALSQQEALSYILRGQGLDSSDQSDNDLMTALLVGLGTAQSGKFIGDVGNVFGIKNLSLDTQGAGNNSKVVVSGQILPNLQLKYGVGIFDSLATFTLRYRLIPRLYLEATSGLEQTIDLIYQFEL